MPLFMLTKDGSSKMAIVRPANPEAALAMVEQLQHEKLSHEKYQERFNAILEMQNYRYVGFASWGQPEILDEKGNVIDQLKAGDSFVAYNELQMKGENETVQ